MFVKNNTHKQSLMFGGIGLLPKKVQNRLESSWAHAFYQEWFCRIDESMFSVLYSEKKSRPNIPVNILVGLETVKSGFGWSDEELYNRYLFDLQVRYALGLRELDEGYFDLRTLYNFRASVVAYEREHGVNLIARATEQITDEQIRRFEVKTGLQRMDSTQIQSNIRRMSRLQLLVEVIGRFHRILDEQEQQQHEGLFGEYVKTDSLHYCYRIEREEIEKRLQQIGRDLQVMIETFAKLHGEHAQYGDLVRVFGEHYRSKEEQIELKAAKEMSGSTLQSPDDREATYRKKKHEGSRGYVANISETCDPENEVQLITSVSVEPNTTDDQKLLAEDLEGLCERTDLEELLTDGGYLGETAAEALGEKSVELKTSAIKGKPRNGETIGFEEFTVERDEEQTVSGLSCPQGQAAEVRAGKKPGRYSAGFDAEVCEQCPFADRCPARALKKRPVRVLRFTDTSIRVADQRRKYAASGTETGNRRASVESTVRSVIHPFGGHLCKMPVRGKSRITTMTVLSAAMVNIRRITRYLFAQNSPPSLHPALKPAMTG
jgi:hypothetical protein